jgi:4-methyl-5(b-hydroxyethyl)-thiazole monophosphate biosynthesis
MVYILLGTGFEETEAVAPCDILRRAGIPVQFVGLSGREVQGAHGIGVCADVTVDELDYDALDMIVLPGGMGGVNSILACPAALDAVRFAWENDRYVAAICAAPTVLAALGVTDGRKATCYPGLEGRMGSADMQGTATVADGKLLTGAGPGTAIDFGLLLVRALKGEAAAKKVYDGLVYRLARPRE